MTARDHARALLESVADSHDDLTRAVAGVGWALLTDPYPRRETDNTAATGHQRRHVPAVAPPAPGHEPVEGHGSVEASASAYLDQVRLFSHRPGPTLLTIAAEWDDAEVAEWQAQDALEHKAAIEFPAWRKRRTIDGSTFSLRRLVVEFEPKEDR